MSGSGGVIRWKRDHRKGYEAEQVKKMAATLLWAENPAERQRRMTFGSRRGLASASGPDYLRSHVLCTMAIVRRGTGGVDEPPA